MEYNTIKDKDNILSYNVEWEPTLHKPKITTSFWGDILRWFKNKWELKVHFSNILDFWDINIIEVQNSSFILEFEDEEQRNKYQKKLEEKIIMKNTFMSEELEDSRQIPWVDWSFEREWKFYIITHSYLKNTDETNPEKWIYKWNIVNPIAYYETQEKIQDSQKSVWDSVKDIIDNSELD